MTRTARTKYSQVRRPLRLYLEANPDVEHRTVDLAAMLDSSVDSVVDALGKMVRSGEATARRDGIYKLYKIVPGSEDKSRRIGDDEAKRAEWERAYFARKAEELKAARLADPQAMVHRYKQQKRQYAKVPRVRATVPDGIPRKAIPPQPRGQTVAEFKALGGEVQRLPGPWD